MSEMKPAIRSCVPIRRAISWTALAGRVTDLSGAQPRDPPSFRLRIEPGCVTGLQQGSWRSSLEDMARGQAAVPSAVSRGGPTRKVRSVRQLLI